MKKATAAVAALVFALSSTGCASILFGDTQNIKVDSYPSNAEVRAYKPENSRCATFMSTQVWNLGKPNCPENPLTEKDLPIAKGTTPVVLEVPRKSQGIYLVLEKNRCGDESVWLKTKSNHSLWGNLIFLPVPVVSLIGVAIDAGTGGYLEVQPDTVYEKLQCREKKVRQDLRKENQP